MARVWGAALKQRAGAVLTPILGVGTYDFTLDESLPGFLQALRQRGTDAGVTVIAPTESEGAAIYEWLTDMGVVVDWLGKGATAPEPPPAHSTPRLIIADTLPRPRLYPEIPKQFEAAGTSRGMQIRYEKENKDGGEDPSGEDEELVEGRDISMMEWEDFDLLYIFVSVSGTVRTKKGYMVKLDEKLPLTVAGKRKITCNIYSNGIQAVKGRTEDGEEMTLKIAKVNSVRGWRKVMDELAETDDPIRIWASSSGREGEMPTMMRGIIDWADENPRKSIILYMTPEESDKKLMMSEASVIYENVSDKEVDETKKTLRDWVYKGDPGKYKINMHKRGKAKEVPGYDPFQEPELIRMTSRRVPTPWIPELRNPRLNSWEQSMIGGCEEEESTVPVAGLSLQDIIPQRESGESTECFLTRCVEAGVGTQLLDSPGGKAILRSRGAVIPKSVKPSDIVYNQGGTPGEDNMDAVVTKLINQVRKGELGLQLAMRSLLKLNPKRKQRKDKVQETSRS